VKFPRLFLALLALALVGCQTRLGSHPWPRKYKLVRVTNPRGELIADWIAQGGVWQTERGYRFRAIERTTGYPIVLTTQYPHGRRVEVGGPNIVVSPVRKPLWLAEREGHWY
jgi:hypothetical protein